MAQPFSLRSRASEPAQRNSASSGWARMASATVFMEISREWAVLIRSTNPPSRGNEFIERHQSNDKLPDTHNLPLVGEVADERSESAGGGSRFDTNDTPHPPNVVSSRRHSST